MSDLQKIRLSYKPLLPTDFSDVTKVHFKEASPSKISQEVVSFFPHLSKNSLLHMLVGTSLKTKPLRIGVVLSGGQAPGGHNVIAGVFDALHTMNSESMLVGFLNGPIGIIKNEAKEITKECVDQYRNQGGFDIIGSGRTKIETKEQFKASLETVTVRNLDGLIVVGGDDSNTNAALLAEYFIEHGCGTKVIGVPKTIDGDLQAESIELSFGFDSACKTYSETIGNIARDALSAKKYYYFIKLMGRSASHITLECALSTQPNLALIGEEIQQKKQTLEEVVFSIADLIVERQKKGKEYGVILIPEGIVEFIEDFKSLIQELNSLCASTKPHTATLEKFSFVSQKIQYIKTLLTNESVKTFSLLSQEIQLQLLLDRDPHGNVQVSKIEIEKLFIMLVEKELAKRKEAGKWLGKFSAQPIFCGYEGRSCLPSNFDCNYCYALGNLALLLIAREKTGYIASFTGLSCHPSEWKPTPVLLASMIHLEIRDGKEKPVIEKALVNLHGKPFTLFQKERDAWRLEDVYLQPGPIQFFGPQEITDRLSLTTHLT